jgi:pimeloyl-ACP methyl ester carboxylesterase
MSQLLNFYRRVAQRRLSWQGVRSSFHGEPGTRLHVYEYQGQSDGHDFVLVHGLGADAAAYALVIQRLLPYARRLWAPELPGHGFSDTIEPAPTPEESFQLLAKRLDALIERPVVLIGTSLGGAAAMKYALHAPQNVARLMLVSPAGAPMSTEGLEGVRNLFLSDSIKGAREFLRRLYHRPPLMAPIMAWFIRASINGDIVKTFLNTSLEESFLKAEQVDTLAMETLLLWGTSERILPHECLRWYQTHMPSTVTIEQPQDFGHAPHLERPGDLVERILAFAAQSDKG